MTETHQEQITARDGQSNHIVIYGAGGCGRSVLALRESCRTRGQQIEAVCFVDDDGSVHGQAMLDLPVMGLQEARARFPRAKMIGGVGSPRARQVCMEKAEAIGFEFATLIHPQVEMSRWVDIGTGTVIHTGCVFTTRITLRHHVLIHMNCTIGHDGIIDDYTTLCPGVNVSGYVHLGKRVFVGVGAAIINGTEEAPLLIGDDVTIGAGACVTKSIPAGLTVVGVPARPISRS